MGKQTSEWGEEQRRGRARAAAKTVGGRGGGVRRPAPAAPADRHQGAAGGREATPAVTSRAAGRVGNDGRPGDGSRGRGKEQGWAVTPSAGGDSKRGGQLRSPPRPRVRPRSGGDGGRPRRGEGRQCQKKGRGKKGEGKEGGGRREHSAGVTTLDRGRRGRRGVNGRGAEWGAWVSQKRSVRNGASASVGKRVR